MPLFLGVLAVFVSLGLVGAFVAAATGMAAYSLPSSTVNGGGAQAGGVPPVELVARTHLLIALVSMPIAGAITWWTRRAAGQPLDGDPTRGARTAGEGVLWCLVVLPLVFTVGVAASAASAALGQPVDRTAHSMLKLIADGSGSAAPRWMLVGAAVIGAPVIEELIYRALLQRGLMTLTRSAWPAVLLTSAVFTAMHAGVIPSGSFWPAASVLFSLSVLLGLLFARTGSVLTTIVVHAGFNAVSIVAAVYGL